MKTRSSLYSGMFLTAHCALIVEIVNARVFSVLTWYYLGFFAISLAMLGMTAGALWVYLRSDRYTPGTVPGALQRYGVAFALSIPLCHLASLVVRPVAMTELNDPMRLIELLSLSAATATPFFLSGVVITLALTKAGAPIGKIYAADLLGAAAGCIVAIFLLENFDPTSIFFMMAALAVFAAGLFAMPESAVRPTRWILGLSLSLLLAGLVNAAFYPSVLRIHHAKGNDVPRDLLVDRWNFHSRILVHPFIRAYPPVYETGKGVRLEPTRVASLTIDGGAQTVMIPFDGDPAGLDWTRYDVTNIAHHLREPEADVCVIGVGGGRDILSTLAFGCSSVTGVEFNAIFVDLIHNGLRDVIGLADHPAVTIHHDEARTFISRKSEAYDFIQMTLIDTWATTSAGAMTLTENGLYTVEAWRAFLAALRPGGIFTASRWFAPENPSETARTLSLAVAALLEEGIQRPADHIALVVKGRVSSIILSPTPLEQPTIAKLRSVCDDLGFEVWVAPDARPADTQLAALMAAGTLDELKTAARHPDLELGPTYDSSPFFFNIVRPSRWFAALEIGERLPGVIRGNLLAGATMLALAFCVGLMDLIAIFLPLALTWRRHRLRGGRLFMAVVYFAAIGTGFMLIEIGLMQRFSVLLGHPIHSLAIMLFSIILACGFGSFASERLLSGRRGSAPLAVFPIALFALVIAEAALMDNIISFGITRPLPVKAALSIACAVPVGLLLGCFFPLGARLVDAHDPDALPWMWGINGGFSVLGSVLAVIVSLVWTIDTSIIAGAGCYLALIVPILALRSTATA